MQADNTSPPTIIQRHSDMVRKLAKSPEAILSTLTPKKIHLLHAAIGVSGEASELLEHIIDGSATDSSIIEETGDLLFYARMIRQTLGLPNFVFNEDEDSNLSLKDIAVRIAITSGELLDKIKKVVIYDKPLDIDVIYIDLNHVEAWVGAMLYGSDISEDEVLEHNMAKLAKRYPNYTYTNEAAQARADKA